MEKKTFFFSTALQIIVNGWLLLRIYEEWNFLDFFPICLKYFCMVGHDVRHESGLSDIFVIKVITQSDWSFPNKAYQKDYFHNFEMGKTVTGIHAQYKNIVYIALLLL